MERVRSVRVIAAPIQTEAAVIGAVLVMAGIAGFLPGSGTSHGFQETGSDIVPLGGVPATAVPYLLRIAVGVAGIVLARSARGAKLFLVGGGLIFLTLWLYSIACGDNGPVDLLRFHSAHDWLHVVFGVVMTSMGVTLGARAPRAEADGHDVRLSQ
ncbi:DUF4383 domain-containing protein [Kibdelosporangium phytohabitans]|uniref:DUF4383 domain-containing protein n=1 Tax=Kibdelosporangium phytohabitans TaxID=860235 RepID=A0A0N9HWR1_9PSEU|nr:DUF4383 domain-containing protein [Kibdelosporangium phytohabitans]ALG06299.1 hypothetical protein AOZ06_04600 [Kibdelosporangium phytohabitans]MBE1467415.1 hypothetical protein [Kibdelosporangium phytohabitans]